MRIVLATGIYPPDVGGPATYVEGLAKELIRRGEDLVVVTFARKLAHQIEVTEEGGKKMVRVSKGGGPILRWRRYAKALKQHAGDADIVLAFSSISVGIPLMQAKLRKPKLVLRIGGDYFWERYMGIGGRRTLREWYQTRPFRQRRVLFDDAAYGLTRRLNTHYLKPLLPKFHHLAFTTEFQEHIYGLYYPSLPKRTVIQNAFPQSSVAESVHAGRSQDLAGRQVRLLYFGRFVGFKNLPALLKAIALLPHVKLSLVGEGPLTIPLKALAQKLGIVDRVNFIAPKSQSEKQAVFADHDLMIIPSITEISPNSALEARAAGMPVLLSEETGLSEDLLSGMILRPLREPEEIARAVLEAEQQYDEIARAAAEPIPERTWEQVGNEWMELFGSLVEKTQDEK